MGASLPSRDGKKLFAIQGAPLGELVRYDAKSCNFSRLASMKLSLTADFSTP